MSSGKEDLILLEFKDLISQLNNTIRNQNKTIETLNATISNLNEQIEYLKKKHYGSSSEKRSKDSYFPGQMSLFDDIEVPVKWVLFIIWKQ